MLTDRMTARVLAYLVLLMAVVVDSTCFIFAKPETRESSRYIVVVAVSSLPMYIAGALLLWKASRMKEDVDESSK